MEGHRSRPTATLRRRNLPVIVLPGYLSLEYSKYGHAQSHGAPMQEQCMHTSQELINIDGIICTDDVGMRAFEGHGNSR
jgi:hypothetical protein